MTNKILQIIFTENEKLMKYKKGIFFMPELAFTYILGEKLFLFLNPNYESKLNYNWKSEYNLNNNGRTDLVYLSTSNHIENLAPLYRKRPLVIIIVTIQYLTILVHQYNQ